MSLGDKGETNKIEIENKEGSITNKSELQRVIKEITSNVPHNLADFNPHEKLTEKIQNQGAATTQTIFDIFSLIEKGNTELTAAILEQIENMDGYHGAVLQKNYNEGKKIPEETLNYLNNQKYYELRFMPTFPYEKELQRTYIDKLIMIDKIISYLKKKHIHVKFTDRMIDKAGENADAKPREVEEGNNRRYLPIAELQGNNILINTRTIDFLGVLLSIGHIYGHLVQRMSSNEYKDITNFIELPKPLEEEGLQQYFNTYQQKYGTSYKDDFYKYEQEAFAYAIFAFEEAGIEIDTMMHHAINCYIVTDFEEIRKRSIASKAKSGEDFAARFQKNFTAKKGQYKPLAKKSINTEVIPDPLGSLTVVREGYDFNQTGKV